MVQDSVSDFCLSTVDTTKGVAKLEILFNLHQNWSCVKLKGESKWFQDSVSDYCLSTVDTTKGVAKLEILFNLHQNWSCETHTFLCH